ncbi:FG-GAP-like repeat-containing protein [Chitinophagaceae bacterium 26-R-25]|nr:FG-GAP-like repeat-containing protein [Chitinophagaceae bacterium 26-R-25]
MSPLSNFSKKLLVFVLFFFVKSVFAQPVISSFTPTAASYGTSVQIKGTAFSNATAVSFGGRSALSFKVISDTEIVAQVADGGSGNVVVSVSGISGAASGFIYIAPPVINSFAPAYGETGATVTITGNNFSSDPASNIVYFGGARAVVSTASGTSLKVIVPVGATHQPISVTTNNLTGFSNNIFDVTFPGGDTSFSANSFSTNIPAMAVGSLPRVCRVADLDGDGKLDLAVLTNGNDQVTVYKNVSAGGNISFNGDKVALTLNPSSTCLQIADIDGDGLLDIITFTSTTNNNVISIFRNRSSNGKLVFEKNIDVVAPLAYSVPSTLSITDLDGDGMNDFCFAGDKTFCAFRNTGSPGNIAFASMQQFPISLNSGDKCTIATDFDNDGKRDILMAQRSSNIGTSGTLTGFRNISTIGTIAFADQTLLYSWDEDPAAIAACDLNNDGKADLITANQLNYSFTLFKNTSTPGAFKINPSVHHSSGGSNPMSLDINDFDGDGMADLAVANSMDNTMLFFKNITRSDSIIFSGGRNYKTQGSPLCIASGDLSGDGRPDIIVVNRNDNTLSIYKNRVSAPVVKSFTPTTAGTGATVFIYGKNFTGTSSVKFGNIEATSFTVTGDTIIKAIVASGASGNVAVTNTNETGVKSGFVFSTLADVTSFDPVRGTTGTTVTIKGSNFSSATAVNFGKFKAASFTINSDTSITAVVGDIAPGISPVSVINATGKDSLVGFYTGVFITSFAPSSGPIGTTVTISGVNFSTTLSDNIVFFGGVRAQVLSATNTSLVVRVPANATYQPISVGVKGSVAYSASPFIVTFGKGGIPLTDSSFKRQTLANEGSILVNSYLSDLDGDGKLDLLLVNVAERRIAFRRNTSTVDSISFASATTIDVQPNPSGVCAGDLNGDGKPDLAITISAGGGSRLSIWTNTSTNGNISFQFEGIYRISWNDYEYPQNCAINELDGDGFPDIAVINQYETFTIYSANHIINGKLGLDGPTNFSKQGGSAQNYLCDLDGDGKPEMITATANYNHVSVSKNTSLPGHISFDPETVYPAPNGSELVTVGDVDGDGKPDIVVGNKNEDSPIPASFSVLRNTSTLNHLSFAPRIDIPTGAPVGTMAMSDVDGDGKPDVVVTFFHNSNDSIAVYRNTSAPGAVSFAPRVDYLAGAQTTNAVIGDLNSDGKADIVVTNLQSNDITILKNQLASLKPVITSFSPQSGSVKTEVTIKGTRFSNASAVSFGNIAASSFTVVSDTVIIAVVGSGATGDISVTTNEGVAIKGGFKYISSPVSLYSFSPTSGTKGTHVIIKGANLTNAIGVTFGGVAASSFKIVADSVIDAVVGVGASGNLEINTSDSKASLQGFTYLKPAPEIFSFSPASAATGDTVRIVGRGFDSASAVSFGDIAAASFKVISDSVIIAIVGRGASGNINIIVSGVKISRPGFVYIAPKPQILSFSPTSATLGATVTIKGSGFSNVTAVSFGGTDAFSFEIISDSVIKAVVASGASGKVQVSTRTDTTSLDGFIYISQQPNDVIQVYPNPSINGSITVKHPSVSTTSQITIVDMNGSIVKTVKVDPNTDTTKVDVSSLIKGIYRVIWSDGQQKIGLTILVQ